MSMFMSAKLAGHQQGMHHVGLARNPLLAQMAGRGELEGLAERRQVLIRPQLVHTALQLTVETADFVRRRNDGYRWSSTAWVESGILNTSVTDVGNGVDPLGYGSIACAAQRKAPPPFAGSGAVLDDLRVAIPG